MMCVCVYIYINVQSGGTEDLPKSQNSHIVSIAMYSYLHLVSPFIARQCTFSSLLTGVLGVEDEDGFRCRFHRLPYGSSSGAALVYVVDDALNTQDFLVSAPFCSIGIGLLVQEWSGVSFGPGTTPR